nr:HAD hydrolase-like protein [Actinopolyspora mortivallis]
MTVQVNGARMLAEDYDALLLDLDGTVYRGGTPVAGAVPTLSRLGAIPVSVRYVTNNASNRPEQVAEKLNSMSIPATPSEVSTSAQAGAALLAERLTAGDSVLVLGTEALAEEVVSRGLRPVRGADEAPAGVLQGHSEATTWRDLAEACLAIRAGAVWVACNRDTTLPTERGELPGNGSLVAALEAATGHSPVVAGKPEKPLLSHAAVGTTKPLFVGDRLETDTAGARGADMSSMLVLTGVSGAADVLAAPPETRPDYLAADLTALCVPAEESAITPQPEWKAEVTGDGVTLSSPGTQHRREQAPRRSPQREDLTALRTLCAVWWSAAGGPVRVRSGDRRAQRTLSRLGLDSGTDR